jgi:hypothetical protein
MYVNEADPVISISPVSQVNPLHPGDVPGVGDVEQQADHDTEDPDLRDVHRQQHDPRDGDCRGGSDQQVDVPVGVEHFHAFRPSTSVAAIG